MVDSRNNKTVYHKGSISIWGENQKFPMCKSYLLLKYTVTGFQYPNQAFKLNKAR